ALHRLDEESDGRHLAEGDVLAVRLPVGEGYRVVDGNRPDARTVAVVLRIASHHALTGRVPRRIGIQVDQILHALLGRADHVAVFRRQLDAVGEHEAGALIAFGDIPPVVARADAAREIPGIVEARGDLRVVVRLQRDLHPAVAVHVVAGVVHRI